MGRRASREIAMKLLYQMEIQKEDKEDQISQTLEEYELTDSDKKYITEVVAGVTEKVEEIDSLIKKYAKGWKLVRIPKVDLSILRLSIYETNYRTDIPMNISINEAVELAKKYSGDEAGAFINGVLGKVAKLKELPVLPAHNDDTEH